MSLLRRSSAPRPEPAVPSLGRRVLGLDSGEWRAVILGALIGAFTALTFGVQAGIALGIAIAYATWIGLMVLDVSRTGIDTEALQQRFVPTMTIETSKETLEWLRQRMPGSGS